jgi:hypothetical protein
MLGVATVPLRAHTAKALHRRPRPIAAGESGHVVCHFGDLADHLQPKGT